MLVGRTVDRRSERWANELNAGRPPLLGLDSDDDGPAVPKAPTD